MTPHMLAVGVQGRTAQLEGSEAQSQLTNSHCLQAQNKTGGQDEW